VPKDEKIWVGMVADGKAQKSALKADGCYKDKNIL